MKMPGAMGKVRVKTCASKSSRMLAHAQDVVSD